MKCTPIPPSGCIPAQLLSFHLSTLAIPFNSLFIRSYTHVLHFDRNAVLPSLTELSHFQKHLSLNFSGIYAKIALTPNLGSTTSKMLSTRAC